MAATAKTGWLERGVTSGAFVAVMLIGAGVVAGWHLRLPWLVRVLPGAIPMQYNTALCFLALGVSSLLLVTRRGAHPALPALGGFAVALMGALALFQYVTGYSVGIDTLFFYPWDQTLSADPGRMALTTALSFALLGAALVLCALRPGMLPVLAVVSTFPLSFGLTSLLGYLLRVTYMLPFNLGSQMAVHTASAFVVYGGAVLYHAWSNSPKTDDGLPRWSPGIAAAVVPVLFVAFSALIEGGSASAITQRLLLSLVFAALLGLAIYKLIGAKVVHKGLVLVSVPLLFLMGFIGLVTQIKRSHEQAYRWSLHSKEVIAQAEALSRSLYEAESNMRGFVISRDPSFIEPYLATKAEMSAGIERLLSLVNDNPEQRARARRLSDAAREKFAFIAKAEQLTADEGVGGAYIEDIRRGVGKQLMHDFRREMEAFLDEERRLDETRQRGVSDSWQRFDWLLVAGGANAIILAFLLALLFSQGIKRRLLILTGNAHALAQGRALSRPLSGTDEVARLDHVFHGMAGAIEEAARRDRELNETLSRRTVQLESANKELEAFSYSVSHDLRAPLRAIDGFSRIIEEDYGGALDAEGRRLLGVIRRSTQKMGNLIDDLLAFSRLGRKDLSRAVIDMSGMARLVFGDVSAGAQAAPPARLLVGVLPPATGDPAMVRQVFVNLLSNAVKFSKARDEAVVEIGGSNGGAENTYYVRDHGAGFDMQYAGKLFGVFQRLHSEKEFEGTGVGLAIVQRIIHRHGGRVWAESRPGEGATFFFTLPAAGKSENGKHGQP